MTKNKSLKWGLTALCAVLCAALLALSCVPAAFAADVSALAELYDGKVHFAREALAREKAWIKLNQGEGGEIYLNHTEEKAPGDVNPYFACQAAMGLLAGNVSESDMEAAARYLRWHTETLLLENGEITNHRLEDGELVSTGEHDSVDSYIALYLTLLSTYTERGGALAAIPGAEEAAALCAGILQDLLLDGLTRVSGENGTRYMMDNAEVLEACRGAARMAEENGLSSLAETFSALADTVEAAIAERLWDAELGVYRIGLRENGTPIDFSGWQSFYPDALAQIFPTLCGFETSSEGGNAALYASLCEAFRWETLEHGDSRFAWAATGYAAARLGDWERAETYLQSLSERYAEDRSYPFHSAEAGWTARTAGCLLEHYEETRQSGLAKAILEVLKELLTWITGQS